MSETATPAPEGTQVPPAAATPAPEAQGETVTLSKEEYDRIQRDAARAASAQSKLDRLERSRERNGHFGGVQQATPPAQPTKEELEEKGHEEDRKAERGITRLAIDPKYREVLDGDPTLREMITRNPLSLLPVFAPDAFDAEDAVNLFREELDKRLALKKPATNPVTPVATPAPAAAAPNPGAANPNPGSLDTEYEEAKKIPSTERAIASMINIGIKKMGRKSS